MAAGANAISPILLAARYENSRSSHPHRVPNCSFWPPNLSQTSWTTLKFAPAEAIHDGIAASPSTKCASMACSSWLDAIRYPFGEKPFFSKSGGRTAGKPGPPIAGFADRCSQKLAYATADEAVALGQGLAMTCDKTRWREHVAIEEQQDVTLRRLRPVIAGRRPPHSTAANNPAPKRRSMNAKIWQCRGIWIVEHNNQLIGRRPLRGDSRKATGKPGSAAPSYNYQT